MAASQEENNPVDGKDTATPAVLKDNSERTGKGSKGRSGKTVESPQPKNMKTRQASKQEQKSVPPFAPPRKAKVMKK